MILTTTMDLQRKIKNSFKGKKKIELDPNKPCQKLIDIEFKNKLKRKTKKDIIKKQENITLSDLDHLLKNKDSLSNNSWSKLRFSSKLEKISEYLNNTDWTPNEIDTVFKLLKKALEFNMLNKNSDVTFCKEELKITDIKKLSITLDKNGNRNFTLKK